jgi:hypothetical protein
MFFRRRAKDFVVCRVLRELSILLYENLNDEVHLSFGGIAVITLSKYGFTISKSGPRALRRSSSVLKKSAKLKSYSDYRLARTDDNGT